MKTSYSDQLKSPKWQKKRLEILQLHDFKCDECNDKETQLHVHHRFYIKGRKAWEYDNDVFQVLCEKCHSKVHEKKESQIIEKIPDKFEVVIKNISSYNDKELMCLEIVLNDVRNLKLYEDFWSDLAECFGDGSYVNVIDYIKDKVRLNNHDVELYLLRCEIEKLQKQE